MIDCPHWRDINSPHCGGCALGLYGGRPSPGTCHQCEHFTGEKPEPLTYPTWVAMAEDFAKAMADWTAQGFPVVDKDTYKDRLATCEGCEHWNPAGWHSTGKCEKCGCSRVKLWLETQTCPVGKWEKPDA